MLYRRRMMTVLVLLVVVAADLASTPGRSGKTREEGETAGDRRSRDVGKRTQPHFDPRMSTNVTSLLGQTAVLNCRVRNIGNKTVSWIRHRDLHLLAVGRLTYTTDDRFTVKHAHAHASNAPHATHAHPSNAHASHAHLSKAVASNAHTTSYTHADTYAHISDRYLHSTNPHRDGYSHAYHPHTKVYGHSSDRYAHTDIADRYIHTEKEARSRSDAHRDRYVHTRLVRQVRRHIFTCSDTHTDKHTRVNTHADGKLCRQSSSERTFNSDKYLSSLKNLNVDRRINSHKHFNLTNHLNSDRHPSLDRHFKNDKHLINPSGSFHELDTKQTVTTSDALTDTTTPGNQTSANGTDERPLDRQPSDSLARKYGIRERRSSDTRGHERRRRDRWPSQRQPGQQQQQQHLPASSTTSSSTTTTIRGHEEEELDVSDWQLVVESVQPRDTGLYECQISTSPPLSHLIHLAVVEAQTVVVVGDDGEGGGEGESDGAGGVYLRSGDRLVLHCSITHTPAPPSFVLWYHGNILVSYERTKGRREEGRRKEGGRRTGGNRRGGGGGGSVAGEGGVRLRNNAWQNGRGKTKREGKEEDWRRMRGGNRRENSWKGDEEWREETTWKKPEEATWKDGEEATWKGGEATWNNGRETAWKGEETTWKDEGEDALDNGGRNVLADERSRSRTTRIDDDGEVTLNDEGQTARRNEKKRTTWFDKEQQTMWREGWGTSTSRLVIQRVLPRHSGNYTCSPSNSRPASLQVTVVKGDKTAAIHEKSGGAGITDPLLLLPFLLSSLPLNLFLLFPFHRF